MDFLDSLLRRIWKARTRDFWDYLSLWAVIVSAVSTLIAAGSAAISANASREAVEESRKLRNPVFVIEPIDDAVVVQFRTDTGFDIIPLKVNGDRGAEVAFRVTNYGNAPALNVQFHYLWLDSKDKLGVPASYALERVRGLPRISSAGGKIFATVEGGFAPGSSITPISNRADTATGSIGPGADQALDVRVPGLIVCLWPFMLNDAVLFDRRNSAYLSRGLTPPFSPIAHHDLRLAITSDSLTGSHFSQTFIIRFTTAYATDRKDQVDGAEFGRPTRARIEANDRIEVLTTGLPKEVK